jgi:ABC-2 type transport system permease protein
MTATIVSTVSAVPTVSTSRQSSTSYAEPGFGAMLQAEWTKLRSVRSTWIMVALAITLSIGFTATTALIAGMTHDSWNDRLRSEFDPILTTLGGWLFGMILVMTLGVTSVTSEYSSRMVRTTFIVNPRRLRVFAAKATVVGLLGMAISMIVVPGMFLICQPIYAHYGLDTASVTDNDATRYLLIASFLQGTLEILIPFSIAWILRSAAAAITTAIGFFVLPWMLTPLVPLWVKENVFRYLPANARDSLLGQLEPDASTYLAQTSAIIVIAAWIIGWLVAAAIVVNRRDV